MMKLECVYCGVFYDHLKDRYHVDDHIVIDKLSGEERILCAYCNIISFNDLSAYMMHAKMCKVDKRVSRVVMHRRRCCSLFSFLLYKIFKYKFRKRETCYSVGDFFNEPVWLLYETRV